jgi:glycerophosphoryl diester phosphodiesterase
MRGWPRTDRVAVIGHRGAAGHAPENTMVAFEAGLALGADALELDVQLTADGEVVVMHDQTLERLTDGSGWVGDHSLAELTALRVRGPRSKGADQTIPSLDRVVERARDRTYLMVEIKNAPRRYPGIEERVLEVLRRRDALDRTTIISFDHHALRRLRELDGTIGLGLVYACRPVDPVAMARAAGAGAIRPVWPYVVA